MQIDVELLRLVVSLSIQVSFERTSDDVKVSIENGGIIIADVAIHLAEVMQNVCAGLISIVPIGGNYTLAIALNCCDLAHVNRVCNTCVLGDQVCDHSLSDRGYEGIAD